MFVNRWAPWEENLSPEAEFAVESLAPGEEEPVVSWESFEKLNPKWQKQRKKTLQEEEERKEKEKVKPKLVGPTTCVHFDTAPRLASSWMAG